MRKTGGIAVWSGILLITATGAIHAFDAPDSFQEAGYKGALFLLNAAAALAAAYGIFRGKGRWGWDLGAVVAGLSLVLYAVSRTVGLPHIPAEPDAWFEPLGVASLCAEGLFMALYFFIIAHHHKHKD